MNVISRLRRLARCTSALAAALLLGLAAASPASAECYISFGIRNMTRHDVIVHVPTMEVRSRHAGIAGPWRSGQSGGWFPGYAEYRLERHEWMGGTYLATQSCDRARQYRFAFDCGFSGVRTRYFPGGGEWSGDRIIEFRIQDYHC
ncbi:MAG: hypothetical protein KDK12_12375 [Rhodobacteraceae bacterium]|nr:hypothetical protein [Paracoccaceae bacterium]